MRLRNLHGGERLGLFARIGQSLLDGDRIEHLEQSLVSVAQRGVSGFVELMIFEAFVRGDQRIAQLRDRPLSLTLGRVAQLVQRLDRVGERAEIHRAAAPAGQKFTRVEQYRCAIEAQQTRRGGAHLAEPGDDAVGLGFERRIVLVRVSAFRRAHAACAAAQTRLVE